MGNSMRNLPERKQLVAGLRNRTSIDHFCNKLEEVYAHYIDYCNLQDENDPLRRSRTSVNEDERVILGLFALDDHLMDRYTNIPLMINKLGPKAPDSLVSGCLNEYGFLRTMLMLPAYVLTGDGAYLRHVEKINLTMSLNKLWSFQDSVPDYEINADSIPADHYLAASHLVRNAVGAIKARKSYERQLAPETTIVYTQVIGFSILNVLDNGVGMRGQGLRESCSGPGVGLKLCMRLAALQSGQLYLLSAAQDRVQHCYSPGHGKVTFTSEKASQGTMAVLTLPDCL